MAVCAIAFTLGAASSAFGGAYTVRSCHEMKYDGWLPWPAQPSVASWNYGFKGYPCAGGAIWGLHVASYSGYVAPMGTVASHAFVAPAGTSIRGFSAYPSRGDFGALEPEVWNQATGETIVGAGGFPLPMAGAGLVTAPPFVARSVALGIRCKAPAGCATTNSWMDTQRVTLSIEDEQRPTLRVHRGPPGGWLASGDVPLEFEASDNVGVRRLSLSLDGAELVEAASPCYDPATNHTAMPCAGANGALRHSVDVTKLAGGTHALVVRARDVGGNETAETLQIRVDREAPDAPRRLSVAGGGLWHNENRFDVTWSNPPESGSPVSGARYEFCPAANGPYDGAGCVESSGARESADTIQAPHDGEWSLRVALVDAAGNVDPSRAGVVEPLRLDTQPPRGSFQPFDPGDPSRVELLADDSLSGVRDVEIEIRRTGENAWRSVPSTSVGRRHAAVIDDQAHADGVYSIRARITDLAGNERTITTLPDGEHLRMVLPLRAASTLLVGHETRKRVRSARGKRPRYERVLVERPVAPYGASVALSGRLRDPAGNPRVNAAVDVLERVDLPGRDWQHVATVHTEKTGRFTFRAKPGPARVVRFSYRGTSVTQPAVKDVELRVRASVTIRADRRTARNGDGIVFSGRLRSAPIPEVGKVLALQALTPRGWRTFANPRARAANGRWRWQYRFTGTNARSRYVFRVVVLPEAGYPYAQGFSRTTAVVVNP